MTSPRHAESTDIGRYYTHPETGQRLISVTNVLSVSCAKPALVPWAAKICAEWAIEHMPALLMKSLTDREGAVKDIKAQVTIARDKASDLGSAVHAAAEAHVLGKPQADDEFTEAVQPFLQQYLKFIETFGIDLAKHVEATELTVAHPALGYAGTLDLLLWLPFTQHDDGTVHATDGDQRALWLVDIKTSTTRPAPSVYAEYALQLAGLRFATELWLPDDTVRPMKGLRIEGAAVLNLRTKTFELVPVPCWGKERDAFVGCLTHAKWAHATGREVTNGQFRPVTPTGRAKPKRTRKTTTTKKAA